LPKEIDKTLIAILENNELKKTAKVKPYIYCPYSFTFMFLEMIKLMRIINT
jgi:hypothetical protein